MSIATSRVFNACKTLLAPAKSAAASSSVTTGATKFTAAKTAINPKTKTKPKPKPNPKPRSTATLNRPTGILKAMPLSPALRDFLGVPEASRTDAVKQIWVHIKQYNLQNPANKREIICDEKLKVLFDGKEKVGFLEIGKLLSCHFVKTA